MSDPAPPAASLVVCFALPDESRLLIAALADRHSTRNDRFPLATVRGNLAGVPVTVVHTGMGVSPAAREHLACSLAEAPRARAAISAGYAGALDPTLTVGDLVLGENYSSPGLLESARGWLGPFSPRVASLHTAAAAVEDAAGKAALHRTSGAAAVDMETAWIADACAAAGLPLLSLRVISDAADQDFPVPGRVLYDAVRQRPRYVALPLWLALHPGQIAPFVRFVRGLGPARERLTAALRILLANLAAVP